MYCPNCGSELNENQKFCTNCGAMLNTPNAYFIKNKRVVVLLILALSLVLVGTSVFIITNFTNQTKYVESNELIGQENTQDIFDEPIDKYDNPIYTREQMKTGYKFADKIKKAVKNKDINALSNYLSYPININTDGSSKTIYSKDEFIALDTNKIFTERFIQAVCNKEDIFINSSGFMLGNGEIWFSYLDDNPKPKIIAINVSHY